MAARRRDHGGLVFVDLRDRTGVTQLVINPERSAAAAKLAGEVRNEFVLRARGELVARSQETVNPKMATGDVEAVDELEIVSRSTPLPFQLDEENVDETLRLRYRWLDLRREKLQRNLRLRARMVGIIRRHMEQAGTWTSRRRSSTSRRPRVRDFVVPSRLHKGRFFALPQSPQILKQLTMIAGFDRYYQIAICFRDEDLRADRVQELTQLDVEMSFPEREELFALMEEMFATIWRDCLGVEIDAVAADDLRGGRPSLRLRQARHAVRPRARGRDGAHARLAVRGLRGADAVRFLRVPRTYSRAELAALEEVAKERGAKGLAYVVRDEGGEVRSPIAKFSEPELEGPRRRRGRRCSSAADTWETITCPRPPAPAPRSRAGPDRRRDVHVPLGDRFPDVRVGRGRTPLVGQAPSVHTTDGRLARQVRRGSAARSRTRTTSSSTATSSAAALSGSTSPTSRHVFDLLALPGSTAALAVRVPAGRPGDGRPPHGGIAPGSTG